MTIRDTDLYDEDTDSYYYDSNTFCKHGTYIGTPGGPDLMCGACEMGDPDPTPRELRAILSRRLFDLEVQTLFFEEFIGRGFDTHALITVTAADRSAISRTRNFLFEALRWAKSEDDDDWMSRRYRAENERA